MTGRLVNRTLSTILGQAFVLFLLLCPLASVAQEGPSYELNAGDVLEISVWKEEGLTRDVLVLPDGTISFPLAGHVMAAGRSAKDVQDELASRMNKYIPDLVITVSVKAVSGYKVYVIGQVNQPGEFLPGRRIDVMQALSRAGGLTPFADDDDIVILRRTGDRQVALRFNYQSVKEGRDLDQNIVLQSGDVVVVSD